MAALSYHEAGSRLNASSSTPAVAGFRILSEALGLDDSACSLLEKHARSRQQGDENLVDVFVREGLFPSSVARACALSAKGYVERSHVAAMMTDELRAGVHRLIESLDPIPSTVRLTLEETIPEPDPKPASPAPIPQKPEHNSKPKRGELASGTVLGRCVIEGMVGKGGFGTVYRALHRTLRIPVAAKILNFPAQLVSPAMMDQFRQEALLLAQVNHPNVVRVWDFDDEGEVPYLLVEFVDGPTVADVLRQSGTIQIQRTLAIAEDVVSGLDAAAARHIVHHDVKPANIMLERNGRAKITDFGLAAIGRITPEGDIQGTVDYMAPEKAAGEPADLQSDMYSLGVTMFEMLTGVLPFRGATPMQTVLHHVKEAPPIPSEINPHVGPALSALVLRLLEKAPADRFEDYGELLDCLRILRDASN